MQAERHFLTAAGFVNLGSRILKVNHAGENGAIHIYAAQILMARFTAPSMLAELREFKSHEEKIAPSFRKSLGAGESHVAAATGCAPQAGMSLVSLPDYSAGMQ